jgi:predicted transcriptional regulator
MEYVVEQWMAENQIAIEHTLKSEITEDFITKLKGLFEESYISVPEEKFDIVEDLTGRVEEIQTRLDKVMEENMTLKGELSESTREKILANVTEGLAATQAEKLVALAEGVEFDSAENYRKKLELVKENYFPVEKSGKQNLLEQIEEDNAEPQKATVNSPVSFYAQAISRTAKK